jgi:hypothetical protein
VHFRGSKVYGCGRGRGRQSQPGEDKNVEDLDAELEFYHAEAPSCTRISSIPEEPDSTEKNTHLSRQIPLLELLAVSNYLS